MTETGKHHPGSFHIIAITLGSVLSLAGVAWFKGRAVEEKELRSLYALSAGGDKA